MKTTRAFLVGLTSAALLGLPGAALANPPAQSSAPDQSTATMQMSVSRHRTAIRYLPFSHIRSYGSTVGIRGQVVGSAQGKRGALAGVQVRLYRQLNGNSAWVYQATRRTGTGPFPQFTFGAFARQNAHYKVVFGGNPSFQPSAKTTWLTVFRLFHGVITDGTNTANLHGFVTPYYTGKPIALQKRSCAACDYLTVKRTTTGTDGVYSFALPAPGSGRWWWRVAIPGTVAYMASYGGTFTTELR